MKLLADLKRILLTTTACGAVPATLYFFVKQDGIFFFTPFIFSLTVVLCNLDRVTIHKFKAIVLGLMLALPIFFISILSTIGLSLYIGIAAIVIMSSLAGILLFLTQSIYIKMRSFKTGIVATALLAAPVPSLALYISGSEEAAGIVSNTELLFICWQMLAGLGIAVGIWLDTKETVLPLEKSKQD